MTLMVMKPLLALETTPLPQPSGDFGKSPNFNNVSELWALDIKVTLTAWMISFSNLSSIPSLSFFTPIPSFLHINAMMGDPFFCDASSVYVIVGLDIWISLNICYHTLPYNTKYLIGFLREKKNNIFLLTLGHHWAACGFRRSDSEGKEEVPSVPHPQSI